ncbi:hypothetical protein EMCRGX_G034861 [Ephydatia muelleri]
MHALSVEHYGCWGSEANQTLYQLGSRLASQLRCSKSQAITRLYGKFSISPPVRTNDRALRAGCNDDPVDEFLV